MIEPLRLNREIAPPFAISHPVFCGLCLVHKHTKENPNIAIKHCSECPRYICIINMHIYVIYLSDICKLYLLRIIRAEFQ